MLFSATLSTRVLELAWEHMNEYVKVEIRPEQVTADRVTQVLYHVSSREKPALLLGLLRREGFERTLLFVNRKDTADRVVRHLERNGHRVGALTGDIPQGKRLRILSDFKGGKLPFLVATDVASRGLHIEGVSHVVNVDLPLDPEDYVHRIGRTARAGRTGMAISLACDDYVYSLDAIQRLIGGPIPVAHADDELFRSPAARPAAPPVTSGGPRHLPPDDSLAEEPEEAASRVAAPRPKGPPATLKLAAPPPPPVLPERVHPEPVLPEVSATLTSEPPAEGEDGEAPQAAVGVARSEAEFWIREAFGIDPDTPLDEDEPAGQPAKEPGKRKRRRRRRKVKATEGGASEPGVESPEPLEAAIALPSDVPPE
jgi:hypothetical protein